MEEEKFLAERFKRQHQHKLAKSLFSNRTIMVGIPVLILIAAAIFAYVWTNKKRKAQTVATGQQDEQTG